MSPADFDSLKSIEEAFGDEPSFARDVERKLLDDFEGDTALFGSWRYEAVLGLHLGIPAALVLSKGAASNRGAPDTPKIIPRVASSALELQQLVVVWPAEPVHYWVSDAASVRREGAPVDWHVAVDAWREGPRHPQCTRVEVTDPATVLVPPGMTSF